MMVAGGMKLALACPSCSADISRTKDHYHCRGCSRDYPILFGIPDFRLKGDLYLSLEDERAKAARLHQFARTHNFGELVDHYYTITDDVPPDLARKFTTYVHEAPDRMQPIVEALGPVSAEDTLLDLGCGSGGALIAAHRCRKRVGVDIALRWLVICSKRLEELGIITNLFCADAEALPFKRSQFSLVIANDLIEHVRSPEATIRAAAQQLTDGGRIYLSAANRHWPGPHPAVGIWAAGIMPSNLRSKMARRLRGVDVLRHTRFVTAGHVQAWLASAGLSIEQVRPQRIGVAHMRRRGSALALMAQAYQVARAVPGLRQILVALGPAFQLVARKPNKGDG